MRAAMTDDEVARLLAERDGWKAIAIELLKQAFGDEVVAADFPVPPIDLMDTTKIPPEYKARLRQWWADITREHDKRRRAHHPDPCRGSGESLLFAGSGDRQTETWRCGRCVQTFARYQIPPNGFAPSHAERLVGDE